MVPNIVSTFSNISLNPGFITGDLDTVSMDSIALASNNFVVENMGCSSCTLTKRLYNTSLLPIYNSKSINRDYA